MTTDPRDAEIARLTAANSALKGSLTVLDEGYRRVEAERDAALAQVAAAFEVAAAACNKEAEKQATRGCGDFISHQVDRDAINALTPADALAALSRRDAQMRAEGMRKAVEVADRWQADENKPMTMRASILAAAEKGE